MSKIPYVFIAFPTEIYDAILIYGFSKSQLKALLYIVRKTFGYGKPSGDYISISKMAKEIGFSRQCISGAVNDLEKMGVIDTERSGKTSVIFMQVNEPRHWGRRADMPEKWW